MTYDRPIPESPREALARLVAEHGGLHVILAALAAAARPRPRPPDTAALSAHLRRDVGLPEAPGPHRHHPPVIGHLPPHGLR